ncbi:MAG: hypothetical protein AABN34_20920 [Acidobacteriota bacterium]
MTTPDSLRAFVERLVSEERYQRDQGFWAFRSGGSCAVCTDSAIKIGRHFRGTVFGYICAINPGAAIGKQFCEGHDFAVIDNRFLVDYWAFRVIRLITDPVFDLSRKPDTREVIRLYGDPSTWEELAFD